MNRETKGEREREREREGGAETERRVPEKTLRTKREKREKRQPAKKTISKTIEASLADLIIDVAS